MEGLRDREKDSGAGAQHERKLAVAVAKRLEKAAWHCGTRKHRNDGAEGHVSERGQTSHSADYVTLAQTDNGHPMPN